MTGETKQALRNFLQRHYSDERLAMLLAHAQSGKLSFHSCCCFVGVATAKHALYGMASMIGYSESVHYLEATHLSGAQEAELAYKGLCGFELSLLNADYADAKRRRLIIPIIRAEIKRREIMRKQIESHIDEIAKELVAA